MSKSLLHGIFLLALIYSGQSVLAASQAEERFLRLLERYEQPVAHENRKCGFAEMLELHQLYPLLSADLQKRVASLLQMPQRERSYVSPSGRFTLYYNVSGFHAVPNEDLSGNGVPDFIDSAAAILDHIWQVEVEEAGFRPPPDIHGNPVESYPVIFSGLSGVYGQTYFDLDDEITLLPGNNYPSYMELDNDFQNSEFATRGLDGLRVTAAHEFHHAIQLGYHLRNENGNYPDIFFMEMSSTFMEEYVYPKINDYLQYVHGMIPGVMDKPLNETDGNSEYAHMLFIQMIVLQHGIEVLRSTWENIINYPALQAVDITLRDYDDNFADAFNRYAGWLYFSGEHAIAGMFFPDAAFFPTLYLFNDESRLNEDLPPLQMRLVKYTIEPGRNLLASLHNSNHSGRVSHILDGRYLLKPTSEGNAQLLRAEEHSLMVVVQSNESEDTLREMNYWLRVAPTMPLQNPVVVKNGESGSVHFINLPQADELDIFAIDGRKVHSIRLEGRDNADWDLRNHSGRLVASGMYIYAVYQKGRLRAKGKMIILK